MLAVHQTTGPEREDMFSVLLREPGAQRQAGVHGTPHSASGYPCLPANLSGFYVRSKLAQRWASNSHPSAKVPPTPRARRAWELSWRNGGHKRVPPRPGLMLLFGVKLGHAFSVHTALGTAGTWNLLPVVHTKQ